MLLKSRRANVILKRLPGGLKRLGIRRHFYDGEQRRGLFLNSAGWKGVLVFAYLALLSSVAFAVWSLLRQYHPVGENLYFQFLIPIFGAVLSAVFLGETILEWKYLAALCLVCAVIAMVNAPKRMGTGKRQRRKGFNPAFGTLPHRRRGRLP